jgi:hypothetical protein
MRKMDGYNPWVDYSEDLLSELNIFSNMSINHGIHITIDEGDSHGLRCDPRVPMSDGRQYLFPPTFHANVLGTIDTNWVLLSKINEISPHDIF